MPFVSSWFSRLMVVAAFAAATPALAEPADLVFRGGPVHTADDARPTAEDVRWD